MSRKFKRKKKKQEKVEIKKLLRRYLKIVKNLEVAELYNQLYLHLENLLRREPFFLTDHEKDFIQAVFHFARVFASSENQIRVFQCLMIIELRQEVPDLFSSILFLDSNGQGHANPIALSIHFVTDTFERAMKKLFQVLFIYEDTDDVKDDWLEAVRNVFERFCPKNFKEHYLRRIDQYYDLSYRDDVTFFEEFDLQRIQDSIILQQDHQIKQRRASLKKRSGQTLKATRRILNSLVSGGSPSTQQTHELLESLGSESPGNHGIDGQYLTEDDLLHRETTYNIEEQLARYEGGTFYVPFSEFEAAWELASQNPLSPSSAKALVMAIKYSLYTDANEKRKYLQDIPFHYPAVLKMSPFIEENVKYIGELGRQESPLLLQFIHEAITFYTEAGVKEITHNLLLKQ